MALMSIGLILFVMLGVIPFFNSIHMQEAIEHITATYAELSENQEDYSEDDWVMRLASFSASVSNFANKYSRQTELIEQFRRYELLLNGIDPDDPELIIETPQERLNKHLIKYAKERYVDITELTITDAGLSMLIKNPSDRIIAQVQIWLQGYDAEGNPAGDQKPVKTRPILSQEEGREFYTLSDLSWTRANVASAKIVGLNLIYGPNDEIYFQPVVCEELWP